MTQSFFIVWPERRMVSATQVRCWYADAKCNGELDATECGHKCAPEMAFALHRAGLITLATP